MIAMSVRPIAVAVPFNVWSDLDGPVGAPNPRLHTARLVVGGVGTGRQLAVAALAGEPRLDVVLLGRGAAEVARRDVHHPVGDLQVRR